MFPPPCLTVGMVLLGSYAAFLLLQTRQVELMIKDSILVSSDHNTFTQFSSESFRCSLASFRRACTCAFLSRGTLRVLQDFSPSRRSVFLVTMVPAALRSLTRSTCVVLGWFLTVLMIFETPRGEILHGAPVWGRLTVILCFFHLRIFAQLLSPSHQAARLQSCPDILGQLFGLGHGGEFGIWLIDCFCGRVVFYTGNKLRLSLRECS